MDPAWLLKKELNLVLPLPTCLPLYPCTEPKVGGLVELDNDHLIKYQLLTNKPTSITDASSNDATLCQYYLELSILNITKKNCVISNNTLPLPSLMLPKVWFDKELNQLIICLVKPMIYLITISTNPEFDLITRRVELLFDKIDNRQRLQLSNWEPISQTRFILLSNENNLFLGNYQLYTDIMHCQHWNSTTFTKLMGMILPFKSSDLQANHIIALATHPIPSQPSHHLILCITHNSVLNFYSTQAKSLILSYSLPISSPLANQNVQLVPIKDVRGDVISFLIGHNHGVMVVKVKTHIDRVEVSEVDPIDPPNDTLSDSSIKLLTMTVTSQQPIDPDNYTIYALYETRGHHQPYSYKLNLNTKKFNQWVPVVIPPSISQLFDKLIADLVGVKGIQFQERVMSQLFNPNLFSYRLITMALTLYCHRAGLPLPIPTKPLRDQLIATFERNDQSNGFISSIESDRLSNREEAWISLLFSVKEVYQSYHVLNHMLYFQPTNTIMISYFDSISFILPCTLSESLSSLLNPNPNFGDAYLVKLNLIEEFSCDDDVDEMIELVLILKRLATTLSKVKQTHSKRFSSLGDMTTQLPEPILSAEVTNMVGHYLTELTNLPTTLDQLFIINSQTQPLDHASNTTQVGSEEETPNSIGCFFVSNQVAHLKEIVKDRFHMWKLLSILAQLIIHNTTLPSRFSLTPQQHQEISTNLTFYQWCMGLLDIPYLPLSANYSGRLDVLGKDLFRFTLQSGPRLPFTSPLQLLELLRQMTLPDPSREAITLLSSFLMQTVKAPFQELLDTHPTFQLIQPLQLVTIQTIVKAYTLIQHREHIAAQQILIALPDLDSSQLLNYLKNNPSFKGFMDVVLPNLVPELGMLGVWMACSTWFSKADLLTSEMKLLNRASFAIDTSYEDYCAEDMVQVKEKLYMTKAYCYVRMNELKFAWYYMSQLIDPLNQDIVIRMILETVLAKDESEEEKDDFIARLGLQGRVGQVEANLWYLVSKRKSDIDYVLPLFHLMTTVNVTARRKQNAASAQFHLALTLIGLMNPAKTLPLHLTIPFRVVQLEEAVQLCVALLAQLKPNQQYLTIQPYYQPILTLLQSSIGLGPHNQPNLITLNNIIKLQLLLSSTLSIDNITERNELELAGYNKTIKWLINKRRFDQIGRVAVLFGERVDYVVKKVAIMIVEDTNYVGRLKDHPFFKSLVDLTAMNNTLPLIALQHLLKHNSIQSFTELPSELQTQLLENLPGLLNLLLKSQNPQMAAQALILKLQVEAHTDLPFSCVERILKALEVVEDYNTLNSLNDLIEAISSTEQTNDSI